MRADTRWQYLPDGEVVGIPFRTRSVRDAANVLVAGRCFSATHDAHASVRSMAQCMAMGQAAGTAAGLAATQRHRPAGPAPRTRFGTGCAATAPCARQGVSTQGPTHSVGWVSPGPGRSPGAREEAGWRDELVVAGRGYWRHAHQTASSPLMAGSSAARRRDGARPLRGRLADHARLRRRGLPRYRAERLRASASQHPASSTPPSACATCPARCRASRTSRSGSAWRLAWACPSAASTTAPQPPSRSGASGQRAVTTT